MRISFPYPEIKPLDVPEQNLLGSSLLPCSIGKSEEELIEEAFSQLSVLIPYHKCSGM